MSGKLSAFNLIGKYLERLYIFMYKIIYKNIYNYMRYYITAYNYIYFYTSDII